MVKKSMIALLFLSYGALASQVVSYVPTTHVFAPMGFDSNDNAEVIVTGFLPNLCYKAPQYTVSVVNKEIKVDVKALNNTLAADYCLEMIVPFVEVINLGVLDKGNYKINVNADENKNKNVLNKSVSTVLNISETSSDAIDDFIYANVENVLVDSGDMILEGYNPSDCLQFDGVKFADNGVDTYSVLPKMKKVSEFCPMKLVPFKYRVEMPNSLKANNILLHVRVMDGKSVNRVVPKEFR